MYIHAYIPIKIAFMKSGNLKTYKYVKISKSIVFIIITFSLHSTCLESRNASNLMIYFKHNVIIKGNCLTPLATEFIKINLKKNFVEFIKN